MKHTLALLTALLLALLAASAVDPRAGRDLSGGPTFGKLRAGSFQPLEILSATHSKSWN